MQRLLSGARIWLIAGAAFLVWGAAAYFFGTLTERGAREREASAARDRYSALNAQLESAQARFASQQSVSELLTSNIWICRAAVALDNRNFGVAEGAVANAVTSLNKVDAGAAGLDAQALRAAREQASAIQISVATNLASQRSQLLRLEEALAALLVSSPPAAGASGGP